MDWFELLLPIVREIVLVAALVVAGLAIQWWRTLVIEQWIKDLVEDAVFFAKEKYWDKTGAQKFEQAKKFVLNRLAERGIKINESWLDGLIDAVVGRFRDEWESTQE